MRTCSAVVILSVLLTACVGDVTLPTQEEKMHVGDTQRIATLPLIIVGQGGPSGSLVKVAARTYQREHGGVLVSVSTGDAFIDAVRNFVRDHGQINTFVYFGHGNHIALFVNQTPGVHGSIYANDPRLVADYSAASIYELPAETFAADSRALFYGCNVARFHPAETFASAFANHFRTTVIAATGPTEFSHRPDTPDSHPELSNLASVFDGPLYMVPTFPDQGFIDIQPETGGIAGYADVTPHLRATPAIEALRQRGLSLSPGDLFKPYQAITYEDARSFCMTIADTEQCRISAENPHALMRNLEALALLLDAFDVPVRATPGSHQGYVEAGTRLNVLTPDFIHKRWFTRAEMAELTWNVWEKVSAAK